MSSTSTGEFSYKRPWLVLVLTILLPGLGHVYLTLWKRAIAWFGLYFVTTTVIVPEDAMPDTLSVDAFVAAGESMSAAILLLVFGVSLGCLADAYLMTRRLNGQQTHTAESPATTCPNCGRELDEDLTFCHWCTTELDEEE